MDSGRAATIAFNEFIEAGKVRPISTEFARALLNKHKENFTVNNLFSQAPQKAKLEMTYNDGTVQVVDFYVQRVDMKHDIDVCDIGYGLSSASARSCNVTLTGLLDPTKSFVIVPAKKKQKPEPKPKLPSVSTSARAVRKATVKHAQLTKKIQNTELALQQAKAQKQALDAELQKSREQLLAAAGGVPSSR